MNYKEYIERRVEAVEAAEKIFKIDFSTVIRLTRLSLQPKILDKTCRIGEKLSKVLGTQVEPADCDALIQLLMQSLVLRGVRTFNPFETVEDAVNNSLILIEELIDDTMNR